MKSLKQINWLNPKVWAVLIVLNIVGSPTMWVLAIHSIRQMF